jgi:cytochrome c-type biogenesis protein CcmH
VNRRLISVAFAALVTGLLLIPVASAQDVYSDRTMELARQLQCPVCDGQAVADSQVTLARQMRDVIEQKVQAGESDEQIMAYFTERYGQNVLLDPPKSGFNLTLWWIPPAVLLVGALVVFLYMREGTSSRTDSHRPAIAETSDPELEELAREYLDGDANARRS